MYNIDWHDQQIEYAEQLEILGKMDNVMARSKDHAKLIKSHFHIEAEVNENYDYNQFMKDK
jgi:hypothetical protein